MPANATVYLVDDDPGALESLRFLLETNGFSVEVFASAEAFLDAYDPDRAACLVLDLQMPRMNGLALQQRLREQAACLPVIFVTGHGDVSQCRQAFHGGAIDFLEKPVPRDVILSRVRQALETALRTRRVRAQQPELTARIARLTPRERETMDLLVKGEDMKTIAARLGIGIQTVAKHRARVLHKMEVRNEAELVTLLVHYPVQIAQNS